MIYNTAVKATETVTESTTSPLQFMLYLAEAEGKMFDSLINIDFMDALNEDLSDQEEDSETGSGINPAMDQDTMPEEKKKTLWEVIKKIGEKIVQILKDAWEAISGFFEKVSKNLGMLLKTNKGLVEKYGKIVTDPRNIADFEGLENFPQKILSKETRPSEFRNMDATIDRIKSIPNVDASTRQEFLNDLKNEIKTSVENAEKDYEERFAPVEGVFKPTVQDMQKFLDILGGKRDFAREIKEKAAATKKELDKLRTDANQQQSQVEAKIRKDATPDYAAAWKDYFNAISYAAKIVTRLRTVDLKSIGKEVGAARKAVLAVGNFAAAIAKVGKPSDEVKEEGAAFREMLCFKSDVFVESVFEM